MKLKTIQLAALALSALAGTSQASVTFSGIASNTEFTVDATTPLSIVNADVGVGGEGGLGWGSLDDGAFPTSTLGNQQAFDISGDANGNGMLYKFTAGAATIGSISMYSGWSNNGRMEQHFSVYTTTDLTVTGSSTWTLLATVGGSGSNGSTQLSGATEPSYLKTTIFNDSSAILASGITGLRFNFSGANLVGGGGQQNGYVGYKELDVQVIPEPSAALIGGLGMLALLRRRR